ncbi:MAG: preprotein translocase subunit SecG, partial [Pseudomonadota bacterium]|nr:preprotein translocase subunit SecG [Pseudomonadota bacterium]
MFSFLLIVQIIVSISIITLVMLQQGKGADMGAAFGSGASGTVFGARGSGSFFTRATGILAMVFF